MSSPDYHHTREIALRALDRRAYASRELAGFLERKGAPKDAIDEVLARLSELRLIDDRDFARQWVANRHETKNLSRRALRLELVRKGIDAELIDEALGQVDSDSEYEAAKRIAEGKLRSVMNLDRDVAMRRMVGALARKGYGPSVAYNVAREVLDDASGS